MINVIIFFGYYMVGSFLSGAFYEYKMKYDKSIGIAMPPTKFVLMFWPLLWIGILIGIVRAIFTL